MNIQKKGTNFRIKLYATALANLNKVSSAILKELSPNQTASVRLSSKIKKLILKKNPNSQGYQVFIKKHLKIHKMVFFFKDLKILKKALKLTEEPNVYVETLLY
jgi:hypothetical protein